MNDTLSIFNATNGSVGADAALPAEPRPLGYAVCESSSFQREMQLLRRTTPG